MKLRTSSPPQNAIAKSFARSFDFSGLAVARPNFIDTGALEISLGYTEAMGGRTKSGD